ncbi:aromatic amino acid lyase, partial [Algimonas porphyrae]
MLQLTLIPGQLSLAQLRQANHGPVRIKLDEGALKDIEASAQMVQQVIQQDQVVYGINTGFGLLANTRIANDDLKLLQRSIVLSHAAGIGNYMQDSTVRLMMLLK